MGEHMAVSILLGAPFCGRPHHTAILVGVYIRAGDLWKLPKEIKTYPGPARTYHLE